MGGAILPFVNYKELNGFEAYLFQNTKIKAKKSRNSCSDFLRILNYS